MTKGHNMYEYQKDVVEPCKSFLAKFLDQPKILEQPKDQSIDKSKSDESSTLKNSSMLSTLQNSISRGLSKSISASVKAVTLDPRIIEAAGVVPDKYKRRFMPETIGR